MNWMELVCENLPEDWEIKISLGRGEASLELIDPDGREIEVCDDDLTADQMLLERINEARERDGLQPIESPTEVCKELAMSASEKRAATTVRRVENLSAR